MTGVLSSRALDDEGVMHAFVAAGVLTSSSMNLAGLVLPLQEHGCRVVQPASLRGRPADGLWTRARERVGVRTADCVPVLLAGVDRVAAIHAGWRGMAARIVERFVWRQRALGAKPGDWIVALGPSADGCCYEVGPDVLTALGLHGSVRRRIDLRRILTERLAGLGVHRVERVGGCTICSGGEWASARRQGRAAGRNVAWIARSA